MKPKIKINPLSLWSRRVGKWGVYTVSGLAVSVLLIKGSFIFLESHQQFVEEKLSTAMTTQVRIGQFQVQWSGIEPELTVSDVRIYHPLNKNQVLLTIPKAEFNLAVWQTIRQLSLRLDGKIHGLNLHIVEFKQGEWAVAELLALGDSRPEVRQRSLTWALAQADWQIDHSQVVVSPWQKPDLVFNDLHLHNQNRKGFHGLRILGKLNQQPFKFFVDLHTPNIWLAKTWNLQSYGQLPVQSWLPWLNPSQLPQDITVTNMLVGGEYWLNVKEGKINQVITKPQLQAVHLKYQQQTYDFNAVSGLMSWRVSPLTNDWQANIEALTGTINGIKWADKQKIIISKQKENTNIALENINVRKITQLAAVLPRIPEGLKQWFNQAQPSGTLKRLSIDLDQLNTPKIASVEFANLSASATKNMIGFGGLSGWINHEDKTGYAKLDITQGVLDLKQIYREPTPIQHLQATLRWREFAEAWLLETNQLKLATPDAHGHAQLRVWMPKADPSAAEMTLLASIYDGNLASVYRYVPWPSAGDDTLAWLKSALLSGSIERGDFLYEGFLLDKPDRRPSTMQMRFIVKDGRLAYAHQWPTLNQLNAIVDIYNRQLTIEAKNTQIYQSIARNISADIADLSKPKLRINAELDTTGEDILRILRETSLKEKTGHFAELVGVKGEVAGMLKLDIPLDSEDLEEDIKVDVMAELAGNPIILEQAPEFDLWLSGGVNYKTGYGLNSLPLQGYLLAQPVKVSLQSIMNAGDVAAVQVHANGQIVPDSLNYWLGDLKKYFQGHTQYNATLTVPVTDDPVHIVFDSDMLGWKINLPEPFAKQVEQKKPIHYEMELETAHDQKGFLMWGDALQTGFEVKNGLIKRMMLNLGESWTGELPPEGLWVRGRLAHVNLNDWLPWWRPTDYNKTPEHVAAVLPALESFNVEVNNLSYLGYLLKNARIGYEPLEKSVRFQVVSNDLSGELILPNDSKKKVAQLNIETLNLPFESEANQITSKDSIMDWQMPPLDIHVNHLKLKQWPVLASSKVYGYLAPTEKGIRLTNINFQNPAFSLEGTLDWRWRGQESTSYSGQAYLANVADIFKAFGDEPRLTSEKAKSQLSLYWLGNPTNLSLNTLNGDLSVDMNKGRILNLNRTLTVSRLLGVLDSDNFKRRLKFDFSDVTQKGLEYDTIRFEAAINKGAMENSFQFNSPSLQAHAEGLVDLPSQKVDERFAVSVPLVSAVPYAAALVVGPVVGGALVAAEAALDDPISKMTTLHYQVQGTWHDPKVARAKNPNLPWRRWFKANKKEKH